jgi:cytochrome oxidase Cu insertion factor (SCO1/SenC/PrrC family)
MPFNVIAFGLAVVCTLFAACSKQKEVVVAEPETPANRVRVPEFHLTDQDGGDFGLNQLRGKIWVANFIFTRCASTCPEQTAELANLQAEMRSKPQPWHEDFRLVSFSVDPQYDSPAVLADYAKNNAADLTQWKFLTGSREKLWRLSGEGFKLPVLEGDSETIITHSSRFALVDRDTNIRGWYQSGDEAELAKLRSELERIAAESPSTPAAKPYAIVPVKGDVLAPKWLGARAAQQIAAAGEIGVDHDFKFSDKIFASGITFEHQIVDDAGKRHKPNHYDHGNGVAVADVDGDGLLDLYFSTQLGSNQLWRNTGGGKFTNITTPEIRLADKVGVSASFADTDNDGDPDLFVTSVRGGNQFFINDGNGKFTDATESAGLSYSGHSSGAVFFDYDRDGLVDLFLCNVGSYTTDEIGRGGYYVGYMDAFGGHLHTDRGERSTLYHNLGGNRFADVSESTGLVDTSWSGDASPIDGNGDEWPDLYVLSMQGNDEYYENVGGKRFEKKGRERFPKTPWGAMGVKVIDFNNDGHMDLFVTDMHSDMSRGAQPHQEKDPSVMNWPEQFLKTDGASLFGNAFFRNVGGRGFVDVTQRVGAENYWPWGLSSGDLNADGFEDAFIASSMNYPFRYGINSVLLNDSGEKFRDAEFILGVEPRRGGRTAKHWFTIDDPAGADADHPLVIDKKVSGPSEIWAAVGTRGSVIFDLDADGDLDIVTNEFNDRPMVLVNDLSSRRKLNWLGVKLVGKKSNRDGLGAKVQVFAGTQTITKVHDGQSGYLSQSSMPLYFGLGAAQTVEKLVISWPSGAEQTVAAPKIGKTLVIAEESPSPSDS